MNSSRLLHEPVEQTDAVFVHVRTDNGVTEGEVFIIFHFAQCFGAVIKRYAITKTIFIIGTGVSGKDAVGAHVNQFSLFILHRIGDQMRQIAV